MSDVAGFGTLPPQVTVATPGREGHQDMTARIWSVPDLPEGLPLPARLDALNGSCYLAAGSVVTAALKSALIARGIAGFVESAGGEESATGPVAVLPVTLDAGHLQRLLRSAFPSQTLPLEAEIAAQSFLRHLYAQPFAPLDKEYLAQLTSSLLDWAAGLPGPPVTLPGSGRPDSWLTEHVLHSAQWTAWIGLLLGLPRVLLQSVVTGALLRDVGQMAVDAEWLYTNRRLDAAGRAQIADHPLYSVSWLSSFDYQDEELQRTIRQHHERFDGQGYPLRLPGPRLSEGAQILTLADTLSAVASRRPWREARPMPEAVQALIQGAGTQFNPDLVRLFVQQVGPYPPGTLLELEGKRIAVVSDSRGAHRWRPEVQVVARLNGTIEWGPQLDLSQSTDRITRVVR